MGRVYDALKRAGANESESYVRRLNNVAPRGELRAHSTVTAGREFEEPLFNVSSISTRRDAAVKSSAFTAHTANASDGKALPERPASRAVGATLNAARPTRATGFVSYDIDPRARRVSSRCYRFGVASPGAVPQEITFRAFGVSESSYSSSLLPGSPSPGFRSGL